MGAGPGLGLPKKPMRVLCFGLEEVSGILQLDEECNATTSSLSASSSTSTSLDLARTDCYGLPYSRKTVWFTHPLTTFASA